MVVHFTIWCVLAMAFTSLSPSDVQLCQACFLPFISLYIYAMYAHHQSYCRTSVPWHCHDYAIDMHLCHVIVITIHIQMHLCYYISRRLHKWANAGSAVAIKGIVFGQEAPDKLELSWSRVISHRKGCPYEGSSLTQAGSCSCCLCGFSVVLKHPTDNEQVEFGLATRCAWGWTYTCRACMLYHCHISFIYAS